MPGPAIYLDQKPLDRPNLASSDSLCRDQLPSPESRPPTCRSALAADLGTDRRLFLAGRVTEVALAEAIRDAMKYPLRSLKCFFGEVWRAFAALAKVS